MSLKKRLLKLNYKSIIKIHIMTKQASFNFISAKSNSRLTYRRKTTNKSTTCTRNGSDCTVEEYQQALAHYQTIR